MWIHTGLDISESGISITILQTFANLLGSPSPYLLPAISIGVTIVEGIVILHYVRQISEHGINGVVVSGTGFFGSLAVFLGSIGSSQFFEYIGVVLWIIGIISARLAD